MATAIYETDLRFYYAQRYSTDSAHAPAIKTRAASHMERHFGILADALGDKPYLLGQQFSAADIYAAMLLTWSPDMRALFAHHPNLKAFYDRVSSRPAIAPVWERNGM